MTQPREPIHDASLDPSQPLPEGGPPRSMLETPLGSSAPASGVREVGAHREHGGVLGRRLDRQRGSEPLVRIASLLGAGLLVGAAARRRTPAMTALAGVALPLAFRGIAGRWPLPREWQATQVVLSTRLVIWRSPHDVYEAWRSFDRLPAVLRHLRSVDVLDERRSRWVIAGPAGRRIEWISEITEDEPGRSLAWRTVDGSKLQQLGSIVFDDWRADSAGPGATLMRVDVRLLPPAGTAGGALASILRPALERGLHEDLRRFKAMLEAGEVPTTDGQPSGERSRLAVHNPF